VGGSRALASRRVVEAVANSSGSAGWLAEAAQQPNRSTSRPQNCLARDTSHQRIGQELRRQRTPSEHACLRGRPAQKGHVAGLHRPNCLLDERTSMYMGCPESLLGCSLLDCLPLMNERTSKDLPIRPPWPGLTETQTKPSRHRSAVLSLLRRHCWHAPQLSPLRSLLCA
jgi:hypothetical protein